MNFAVGLFTFVCLQLITPSHCQKCGARNDFATPSENSISPKACCECDYTDLLTRFMESITGDELAKRLEFRGLPGPEGPIGPEGFQGRPGQMGEMGPIGPPGPRGRRGEPGREGNLGQKGEAGDILVYRQLPGQRVIQLKGEKGSIGPTGSEGKRGSPGLTVVGQKGEMGMPAELTEEFKQMLKGEKGDKGISGRSVNCQHCYRARRKLKKDSQNDESTKIYVPVQGPPGVSIVGSPGLKGEPGDPGRVTKNPVAVLSYEEELSKLFDPYSIGLLAFVRATETLFIQTDRGWKEISFTGKFIDPYVHVHRRRHQRTKS